MDLARLLAMAVTVALTPGCVQQMRMESSVRTRAGVELGCPEREISIRDVGGQGYRARGCGRQATFVCGSDAATHHGPVCVMDGVVERAPTTSDRGAPQVARSDDRGSNAPSVQRAWKAVAGRSTELVDCHGGPMTLTVWIDSDGKAARFTGPVATTREERCIAGALGSVDIGPIERSEVTVRVTVPPARKRSGDSPPGPASPGRPAKPPDAVIRAAIDARGDDILSCIDASRAVVKVQIVPPDQVGAVELRGELAGAPEEGCGARCASSRWRAYMRGIASTRSVEQHRDSLVGRTGGQRHARGRSRANGCQRRP